MANDIVRPTELPIERTNPAASEMMVIDNGSTVAKVRVDRVVQAGRPTATKAEAEGGTESTKAMTPLTVAQAIAARSISPEEAAHIRQDATDAALAAGSAQGSAGTAVGAAGTAQTSAGQAMGFRNFAAKWASAPEGQLIDDNANPVGESAFSWAKKAEGMTLGKIPDRDYGDVTVKDNGQTWSLSEAGLLNVPIYDSAEGLASLSIPDGIRTIRTNRYYSGSEGGGAQYRLKNAGEPDRPGDQASNGGAKRWALPREHRNVRQYGAHADAAPEVNRQAIQFALDQRGHVEVPQATGDYLIDDTLLVRSDTRFEGTGQSFLRLSKSSSIGQVVAAYHEGPVGNNQGNSQRVELIGLKVDGGNFGWPTGAEFGENGVGGAFTTGLLVERCHARRCKRGTRPGIGGGGKGLQIENTVIDPTARDIIAEDCSVGFETGGAPSTPSRGVKYSNLKGTLCDRLVSVHQTQSPPDTSVTVNSALIEGLLGFNCGLEREAGREKIFGAICIDRYSNLRIKGAVLVNEPGYGRLGAMIRHYRGSNCEVEIDFYGDADALIDSDGLGDGFGSTGDRRNCAYRINHMQGTAGNGLVARAGDASNHGGNFYDIKFAGLETAIFNAAAGVPTLFGRFRNIDGSREVEGFLNQIAAIGGASGFPTMRQRAIATSLQIGGIGFAASSAGGPNEQIGTIIDRDLQVIRNGSAIARYTARGLQLNRFSSFASNQAAIDAGHQSGDVYRNSGTGALHVLP